MGGGLVSGICDGGGVLQRNCVGQSVGQNVAF